MPGATTSQPHRLGIVWLRCGDLRLSDNPALHEAAAACDEVVVCFCWCPWEEGKPGGPGAERLRLDWSLEGTALQLLMAEALQELAVRLNKDFGNSLLVLGGDPPSAAAAGAADILFEVLQRRAMFVDGPSRARGQGHRARVEAVVYWNRRTEPWERHREAVVAQRATEVSAADPDELIVTTRPCSGFLFREPEACPIFEAVGRGQHIFKAFWEGWHRGGAIRTALPTPQACPGPPLAQLDELCRSLPGCVRALPAGCSSWWPFPGEPPFSRRFPEQRVDKAEVDEIVGPWRPLTEEGAWRAVERFHESGALGRYRGSITRDAGPQKKESRLSPYYRMGLISMVDVYHYVDRRRPEVQKWLRRSAWRDYAYWMLRYWKELPERPMRLGYVDLEWSVDEAKLEAWKRGKTGFPLVDAGMRELLQTGYLQQNLRHTVGQFLVEVLGVSWTEGEAWFHATLADCDAAINAMMWQHQGLTGVSQWLTGIDCNPVRHARKADPDGDYVRRFCPELAELPPRYLHAPWTAPAAALQRAGVRLGETYPHRVVEDPDREKQAFLARLQRARARHSEHIGRGGCDMIERPADANGRLLAHMPSIWALTERSVKNDSSKSHKGVGCQNTEQGSGAGDWDEAIFADSSWRRGGGGGYGSSSSTAGGSAASGGRWRSTAMGQADWAEDQEGSPRASTTQPVGGGRWKRRVVLPSGARAATGWLPEHARGS